jgi:hypothetical protein
MFALAKEIHARSTISQCLAKAFAWNSALAGTSVQLWAEDFSDVFNKESFNSLPEDRMWDCAIDLVLDPNVMNHPGSTFSHDVSVWIQTHLSGTGLSWMPPRDLLTVETWPRILEAADSGSLRHGIQKTLGTRNPYRRILVPGRTTDDREAYTKYRTGCKPDRGLNHWIR